MLDLPKTVTSRLTLSVSSGTGDADLDGELRYDPADPFAVTLAIGTECGSPVLWTFARELLAGGLAGEVGLGDITIEPVLGGSGRLLRITLSTDCVATLTLHRDPVLEFLMESYASVPTGSEADRIDFDAELAALLG